MTQYTSLAQSLALKEAGLPQLDGRFSSGISEYYFMPGGVHPMHWTQISEEVISHKDNWCLARAFTVGELIEWLPKEIYAYEDTLYFRMQANNDTYQIIYYSHDDLSEAEIYFNDSSNLINALYEAALWWANINKNKSL